jgi:hypothetical protein
MSQLAFVSTPPPPDDSEPAQETSRSPYSSARRFGAPTRDLVALYAARVEKSGVDISPALRERRATLPTSGQPVIGYLAAPVPKLGQPTPVGRGTMTHRQALSELAAAKWAATSERMPVPVSVRLTHPAGALPRQLQPRTSAWQGAVAYANYPSRGAAPLGRLASALAAFRRPAGARRVGRATGDSPTLEPTTA